MRICEPVGNLLSGKLQIDQPIEIPGESPGDNLVLNQIVFLPVLTPLLGEF
jgi:hypothetical protein